MSNLFLQLLLVLLGLTFTIIILRYTLSGDSKSKQAFIAIDGSRFSSQKACDDYEEIYKLLECLYQEEALVKAKKNKEIIGLSLLFVDQIKSGGFSDLKTLISFQNDFKKLALLFDSNQVD